jgi:CubicO group peptidase (beta-lactamase class C family)
VGSRREGKRLPSVGGWITAACVLAIPFAGCASPSSPDSRGAGPSGPSASSAPRFAASGPDAAAYGAGDGYSIGDRSTFFTIPFLVGSHSHLDQVLEGRGVRRASVPSRLGRAASEPTIRFEYQGQTLTLDDYLARHPTTALLIARGDTILLERYQYARNDRHRFTSWSMAKTVTAMLVGIAIAEGRIRSVDDRAEAYVPALAGTEYGRTSLRHLLQMSSGVRFVEEYSGRDDVAQLARDTFLQLGPGGVDAVRKFNERAAPRGTRFSYASVETQVLGLVLTSATGRPAAEYLEQKIWQPIGAEADATWLIDRSGHEATYCCLNAVLRDYARLGLLLARDGNWRGRQIIPAAWVRDATNRHPDQRHLWPGTATPFLGYGYQTWILPGEPRRFAFLGVRGQSILVDPQSRLVMVQTSVRKRSSNDPAAALTRALWEAAVATLGH